MTLIGIRCLINIIFRFDWNNQKCRQIIFRDFIASMIYIIGYLQYIPQLYYIIKKKNTNCLSILTTLFSIFSALVNIDYYYRHLWISPNFIENNITIVMCLVILFLQTHYANEYSLYNKIVWFFSFFSTSLIYHYIISEQMPAIFKSMQWFLSIFIQIINPIPQIILFLYYMKKGNVSCFPFLFRLLLSLRKAYEVYTFSKHFSIFVFATSFCAVNLIAFLLCLILPSERSVCFWDKPVVCEFGDCELPESRKRIIPMFRFPKRTKKNIYQKLK